jgi:hypothetical protein
LRGGQQHLLNKKVSKKVTNYKKHIKKTAGSTNTNDGVKISPLFLEDDNLILERISLRIDDV